MLPKETTTSAVWNLGRKNDADSRILLPNYSEDQWRAEWDNENGVTVSRSSNRRCYIYISWGLKSKSLGVGLRRTFVTRKRPR